MRLTDEQHRLIEAAGGRPVHVLDPRTNRVYVLLPAELYQRVQVLVENGPGGGPRFETGAGPLGPPTHGAMPPVPVKLRDLPLPAEVAEAAARDCRSLGLWRRRYVEEVEEELKLQYYFGGTYVAYLRSADGPVVVAAGAPQSEAFGRQLEAVRPEARRQVVYAVPTIWNDQVSELRTPFHES
jgi:hypothetical protein